MSSKTFRARRRVRRACAFGLGLLVVTATGTGVASAGTLGTRDVSRFQQDGSQEAAAAESSGREESRSRRYAAEVVRLTNKQRRKHDCEDLSTNSDLARAARRHSDDMADHNYFDHTGRDGREPVDRAGDAGYEGGYVGENIAAGQKSPGDVVESWMDSPGHRKNILNCEYTEIGVGYEKQRDSRYTRYWTQLFGRR